MRRIPGLNGAVGTAAGSTLALMLLVCGCALAAMAGPAGVLAAQTRTLRRHEVTGLLRAH